mmetsp:Transcript_14675/g.47220  ORF Transcript_14675/g.47220 Transcript_14675/m.47220 type:complete len:361 (+) Transcript_14675:62-1144(+)
MVRRQLAFLVGGIGAVGASNAAAALQQCKSAGDAQCESDGRDHAMLQMKSGKVEKMSDSVSCCFAFEDASDKCGSCHAGSTAQPGSFCATSEDHCKSCSPHAAWCTGDAAAPTPAPAALAPQPSPQETGPSTVDIAPQSPVSSQTTSKEWIHGTWTTGYWDCCKPSCSWAGKGRVNKPVLSCDIHTGAKLFDPNVKSACDGGSSASCADNKPFIVKRRLSMGFAAAAVSGNSGLTGDENCGQCYELKFTDEIHPNGNWGGSHPDLVGKSMVVQVTNIGQDVTGEHSFDIQIPGAGQGIFDTGCAAQFDGFSKEDFDCANKYGGGNEKKGGAGGAPGFRAGGGGGGGHCVVVQKNPCCMQQ